MAVIGSVANVEVLPVPMLPVSNWGLRLGIGSVGNVFTKWGRPRWAGRWERVPRPLSATSGRGTNCPFVANMWQA